MGDYADHRRVVSAERWIGQAQRKALRSASLVQGRSQAAVACYTARGSDAFRIELFRRADCLGHEHLDNRRLNAGTQVAQPLTILKHAGVVADEIAH